MTIKKYPLCHRPVFQRPSLPPIDEVQSPPLPPSEEAPPVAAPVPHCTVSATPERFTKECNDMWAWARLDAAREPAEANNQVKKEEGKMKEWLVRIVLMVAGVGLTMGGNAWVNTPPTPRAPQIERLIESMGDNSLWNRSTNDKVHGGTIFVSNKDDNIKVVPGSCWAEVWTRKKGKSKEFMSEYYNPWSKVTNLTWGDSSALNKSAWELIRDLEMKELEQ